tara:strand:+ start:373 stop:1359 length:987 start_codon:yes stop_codon:yes gene_type:complete
MKQLMENWRGFLKEQDRHALISNADYVTGVLGVQLPLSEDGSPAYPYSPDVMAEIWREQQLIERWWSGEDVILEGPIGDWWQGTKAKIATYPDTLQMLYRATTDKGKLHTFTKAMNRKGLKIKDKIMQFIDFIIEKGGNFQNSVVQKLVEWAQTIKQAIENALSWVGDIAKPWMKALGLVALSVGLQYAWSKIVNYAKEFLGCGGDDGDEDGGAEVEGSAKDAGQDCFVEIATNFLKDKAKELFGATLMKLADAGKAAVTGGVSKFWGWMKKIAGGVKFVVDSLEGVLEMFKSRGGLNEAAIHAPETRSGNRNMSELMENWRRWEPKA